MEIRAWKRGHSGWELLSLAEARTPDAIISAVKSTGGIIRVDVGNTSHYRTTSDRSRWVALIRGSGEVRELDEEAFRKTLTGWDEHEGAALEMVENIFGEKTYIKHVKFNKDAGTESNNNKN
jgi:hypothetical protein